MSGSCQPPLPSGKFFNAEILGFDNDSNMYIAFVINETIEKTYHEMYEKMERSVTGDSCIADSILKKGLDCIVKLDNSSQRKGGIYARGKILDINPTRDLVKCLLIDDFCELVVTKSQLFPTNQNVLAYNQFSLKCHLADLECFLGSPFLKHLYQEYLKKETKTGLGICAVQMEAHLRGGIPIVRVTFPGSHQSFSSTLQELIPTVGKMWYPPPCVNVKVKLTHANRKGIVWFQYWEGPQLIQIIEDVLTKFNPRTTPPKVVSVEDAWKTEYLSGYKTISIYKPTPYGKAYRVRVNRLLKDGKMMVSFIDYGREGMVKGRDLYSAQLIDQSLCFIPPQCRSFIVAGATGKANFDVDRFWRLIPNDQNIWIRLRDYGFNINTAFRGRITPEAIIFIQPSGDVPEPTYERKRKLVFRAGERPTKLARGETSVRGNDETVSLTNPYMEGQPSSQVVSQEMRSMFWILDRLSQQIREMGLSSK